MGHRRTEAAPSRLGLDENTAIGVRRKNFQVLGTGAVYVVDGAGSPFASLSDQQPEGSLRLSNVQLHVLAEGDRYALQHRRPVLTQARQPAVG